MKILLVNIYMRIRYVIILLQTVFTFSNSLTPKLPGIAKTIVKSTSGLLPQADSIAHHVLSANKMVIDNLLDNDCIPSEFKKPIILFFIELAQAGDSTGSHILSIYHEIVNRVL